jgi:peptide/nickel transport system substrate-binding protein
MRHPRLISRRELAGSAAAAGGLAWAGLGRAAAGAEAAHGLAMHGAPVLRAGFAHLPYADPAAPRSGRITLAIQGGFDSLNPYIVRGVAPDLVPRFVVQTLMARSLDEPFTLYGLVARQVEVPRDRSRVTFHLDPAARFSDGRTVTAADVLFSFNLLRRHGRPFYRANFDPIREARVLDPSTIRFDLTGHRRPRTSAPPRADAGIGRACDSRGRLCGDEPAAASRLRAHTGSARFARRAHRADAPPDYWGLDLPVHRGHFNFDEIRTDFYRDANTLFEAFKVGLAITGSRRTPAGGAPATTYPRSATAACAARRSRSRPQRA